MSETTGKYLATVHESILSEDEEYKKLQEIINQLSKENTITLLGFAKGLLKYQKLTGN